MPTFPNIRWVRSQHKTHVKRCISKKMLKINHIFFIESICHEQFSQWNRSIFFIFRFYFDFAKHHKHTIRSSDSKPIFIIRTEYITYLHGYNWIFICLWLLFYINLKQSMLIKLNLCKEHYHSACCFIVCTINLEKVHWMYTSGEKNDKLQFMFRFVSIKSNFE